MGEYKCLSICLLLFYSVSQVQPWKCTSQYGRGTCYISETTLTLDDLSSSEDNGATVINLAHVDIPDPSPELFARLLDGVQRFYISQSTTAELHIPASLIELSITDHLTPLNITIDRNVSYRLRTIALARLASLPAQIESLHSLEIFACFGTPVLSFDFAMFSKMVNITDITISKTLTNFIRISEALQLPSLRTLRVSYNRITTLNASGWNFPALDVLELCSNQIISVPKHINTFENLTVLRLGDNFIHRIDLTAFTAMKQLQNLNLARCHISEISSNGIVEIPNLKSIGLDRNNLTELDVSSWHMPSLSYINLNRNHLQHVSGFSSLITDALQIIDMYKNPWNCTWLKQVERHFKGTLVSEHDTGCSGFLRRL